MSWIVLEPMISFRLVPFIKAIIRTVLLEYVLNLVTLDYMLLRMVYIVYHDVFVSEIVVFDRVGQLSEFAAWQHLFLYPLKSLKSLKYLK